MSEHTPGPWDLWRNEKGAFVITDQRDGAILCQRNDWDHRAAESIANAHLIVAAPKLLAAAKSVCSVCDLWMPPLAAEIEKLQAAIAEAEGAP